MMLILMTPLASAQDVATFSYQRGTLTINRASPPSLAPMPWQPKDVPATTVTAARDFAVDIRESNVLYQQEGWIDLSGLSPNQGALFIFAKSQKASIKRMTIYPPVDVLWINPEGKITSIAPNIVLANLDKPIAGTEKSKAILLLSGGLCAQERIMPGDMVINSEFFSAAPPILTAPQTPAQ